MNNEMKRTYCISFALIFATFLAAQSPDPVYLKGMASLIQNHNEDAVQSLTDAIDHNNADEQYYLNRAEAYFRLGKFDLSLNDYNEANSISPGSGNLGLAKIYAATGDVERAILYLTRHLQSDFRSPESILTKDAAFDPLKLTDE